MKKALIFLPFLFFTFCLNAQMAPENKTEGSKGKDEVVINLAMIEKFYQADYPDSGLSFSDLFAVYDFESIRLITQAYQSNRIDISSIQEIDTYLASLKTDAEFNKTIEFYSVKKELASK